MKKSARAAGYLFLTALAASASFAATITIGVPEATANAFPFIGTGPGAAGTRYQQAYAAADFTEAMAITDISFFRQQAGTFRSATYSLYLSTITAGIDSLSVDGAGKEEDEKEKTSQGAPPKEWEVSVAN